MTLETASRKLEFDKVLKHVARYATSEPGRALLLSIPIHTNSALVARELRLVTEVKALIEHEGDLPLESVKDMAGAVRRAAISGSFLSARELLDIAGALRAGRVLRSYLAKHRQTIPTLFDSLGALYADKVLEFNIDQAIDPSGSVKTSASKELVLIRRRIVEKYDLLRKRLQGILREVSDLGLTQDDIITTREGRMVIPVKTGNQKRVPGFIHSSSGSGATVFIEPTETLELNNEITELQFQEKREIERILAELSGQVGQVRDEIIGSLGDLARLDSLQARARYSIETICHEPSVSDSHGFHLASARHPLLISSHGYDKTIPIDITLGEGINTLVISGPNAGGKSVAMKCVGLLTLMGQAGLHIPASPESRIHVFRKIYVDIGDEQSIENDLSTFSSHLTSLKEILEGADSSTLVLVDEIGTGTDPTEGGAFAAAILETLTRRSAITIATTHHGFLKVFAQQSEGIGNGAMEFDQTTLQPTYRFKNGVPGSSYALEMARRLRIDEGIVLRAAELLGHRESRLEALLMELEAASQNAQVEQEHLAAERTKLKDLVASYEERIRAVARETREQKNAALLEAAKILDDANALVERSIREIRESGAEKEKVRTIKAALTAERDRMGKEQLGLEKEQRSGSFEVNAGDVVTLSSGGEAGRIESIDAEKEIAYVQFGSLRVKVNVSDLVISNQALRPGWVGGNHQADDAVPMTNEVDVRGMTGDEAIGVVDKFIDSAILGGLHRIDIIHGKGTGALRKRLSIFLADHPRVHTFRLGEWNEGGSGATIVELGG